MIEECTRGGIRRIAARTETTTVSRIWQCSGAGQPAMWHIVKAHPTLIDDRATVMHPLNEC